MDSQESPAHITRSESIGATVRAILFDAKGRDRTVPPNELSKARPKNDRQLLWVDVPGRHPALLVAIAEQLRLPRDVVDAMLAPGTTPELRNTGAYFWVRAVAVARAEGLRYTGAVLNIVAGSNCVVTFHASPIDFLDAIRERESGDSELGRLSSASFTASVLDWHLTTYFDAVANFEIAVERLEVELLSGHPRDCIAELRDLRKAASRLRRMLAPHRVIFSGLSRPDFRPQEDGLANGHFLAIDDRFERAMDIVENARDLVVGSFELFSSQNALATNAQMRTLTFVTVVIGLLAVLAGILGMNFDAPFFKAGQSGFWTAVGSMVVLVVASFIAARSRKWL